MVARRPYGVALLTSVVLLLLFCLPRFSNFRPGDHLRGTILPTSKPTASDVSHTAPDVSRHLVVCKIKSADTSWIERELPTADVSIYVVDDPQAQFTVPKNKGRESMAYLTYIIDHYDKLADIEIFLHSDQLAWHNNDLLDDDSAKVVKALSAAHVLRVGYLNLRCHHEPGCPDWLHIDKPESELNDWLKLEERYYTSAVWREMHPYAPIPSAVSQPSGNQFAVSRATIRSQPRSEYIRYREWLLNTPLEDKISGRFFEYIWQFVFTGQAELCPPMNLCYCEGFGICFGGPREFDNYFELRKESRKWSSKAEDLAREGQGEGDEAINARGKSANITRQMNLLKDAAFIRGEKPENRAKEGGRSWSPGDGFRKR